MSKPGCLAVMYHYVRDSHATTFPGIRALPPEMFSQQLDWLERSFTIVTPARLEAAVAGEADLPPDAAVLTFDDGFIDHFETVFPELHRRGLSGIFFVAQAPCSDPPSLLAVHRTHFLLAHLGSEAFGRAVLDECRQVGSARASDRGIFGVDRWEASDERRVKDLLNYELPFDEAERVLDTLFARHLGEPSEFARTVYVNPAQIGEMARGGMVFGYHTRTHRMLSRLNAVEQERELAPGVAWIRELTGQQSVSFCYPWGGTQTYTGQTVALLERLGYSVAFNTVRRRLVPGVDGRFELPRVDTRDLPPYTAGEPVAVTMAGTH